MLAALSCAFALLQEPGAPTASATAPLDTLFEDFVKEYSIPGASVAVAKDGKLLYARGFGVADPESGAAVQSDSLFRIASVSKPLTALTVLLLVEDGQLALDDLLVDRLPMAREALNKPGDPWLAEITLRHLLNHTGGWDRDLSGDIMFQWKKIRAATPAEIAHPAEQDVARYGLAVELDHQPGTHYAYSNFGYLLLGLILEERTGKSYETLVHERLLTPLGIAGPGAPRLGRTLLEHRAPGEVIYHARGGETSGTAEGVVGKPVPHPYGAWNLEWMDAHGGWIASAVDLVHLADAVQSGKLLSAESSAAMMAPPQPTEEVSDGEAPAPKPGVHYGLGWSVRTLGGERGHNLWHGGSLPGTSTILVMRHDGYSWAVLFNTRDARGKRSPSGLIDPLMHRAVDAIKSWPDARPFAAPQER